MSTIHRAKGLEFENVVVVMPGDWRDDTDPAETRAFSSWR